jgi:hypothetical protein
MKYGMNSSSNCNGVVMSIKQYGIQKKAPDDGENIVLKTTNVTLKPVALLRRP